MEMVVKEIAMSPLTEDSTDEKWVPKSVTQTVEIITDNVQRCRKCKIEVVAEPLMFRKDDQDGKWKVIECQYPSDWGRLQYNHVWSDDIGVTPFSLPVCGPCMKAILAFVGIDPEKLINGIPQ